MIQELKNNENQIIINEFCVLIVSKFLNWKEKINLKEKLVKL